MSEQEEWWTHFADVMVPDYRENWTPLVGHLMDELDITEDEAWRYIHARNMHLVLNHLSGMLHAYNQVVQIQTELREECGPILEAAQREIEDLGDEPWRDSA
ncbi:MAG: hypothetical protein GWN53_17200 [Gammaproteobacteria bacterium]|uniref:Uncharacterized protein n=1 Tax=Candidatus Kutchimonas denitrificans TaxID=3056748 RepID=A0AAE4ZCB0_9BACT|nr:hypothetical protein [Candidatus Kutchimonas denitrificans]NIV53579.1 hypothetical protein [Gammaproteobacteria bacterium]